MAQQRKGSRLVFPLVVAAVVLTGCADAEPNEPRSELSTQQVRIMVNPDDVEQLVLGEIYRQSLQEEHRSSALVHSEELSYPRRIDALMSGDADMLIGCVGNLFNAVDPAGARSLEAELKEQELGKEAGTQTASVDELELTHKALMGSLPTYLTTVDPSSAVGCAGSEDVQLPQDYAVIYAKDLLNREERQRVTSITKYLTTADLASLVAAAKKNGNVEATVAQWLDTNTVSDSSDKGAGQS